MTDARELTSRSVSEAARRVGEESSVRFMKASHNIKSRFGTTCRVRKMPETPNIPKITPSLKATRAIKPAWLKERKA